MKKAIGKSLLFETNCGRDYVKSSFVFDFDLSLLATWKATRYITDVTALREGHQMTIDWIVPAQHTDPITFDIPKWSEIF